MREKWIIWSIMSRVKTRRQLSYIQNPVEKQNSKTKWILNILIFEREITNKLIKTALENIIYPRANKEHKNILENQKQILIDYLIATSETKIWKNYNFEKILINNTDCLEENNKQIYKSFSKNVPISEYDQFKKRIDLAKNKKDIIRPWKINKFSASAGTTAVNQKNENKKIIPVTYESMKSTQKAWQEMLSEYVAKYPDTEIFRGYTLPLVWSIQNISNNNSITWDVSALILLERNRITKIKYAFDIQSLIEPNRNKKRKQFGKQLDPNKKLMMIWVTSRADELLNYREKEHSNKYNTLIKNKNMEVIIWGGVDVAPYIKKFNKLWIRYIWNYNASEWAFGYQNITKYDNSQWKAAYKLLGNHWIFYEFIPFNWDNFNENGELKLNTKAKPLRDIKQSQNKITESSKTLSSLHTKSEKLALVITTNSGLLRYLIGDVIEFIDDEYNFKIVWRTRQCLNLKWEELMETHINFVINQIAEKHKIQIKNYTVWPDNENSPKKHQRIVKIEESQNNKQTENSKIFSSLQKKNLTKTIDMLLQEINPDYKSKRKNNILLKMPEIIFTKSSDQIFYKRLKSKWKLWWQAKIPKLSHNRKILDELLKFL